MRRSISILALVGALSLSTGGCHLFQKQALTHQREAVEAQLGKPISAATPEELEAAVTVVVGEKPEKIDVSNGQLTITLKAPVQGAVSATAGTIIDEVKKAPGTAGAINAGLAGLMALFTFLQRRSKLS